MYWLCFVCDKLNEKYIKNDSKIYHSSEPPYRKYCTVCGTLNPIHNITLSDHVESIIDGYCTLNSIIDTFPFHTDGEEYYYITPGRMTILRNSINFNISTTMIYNHLKSRMYYNSRNAWKNWHDKQRLKRRNNCNGRYKILINSKLNMVFRPRPMANILAFL